MAYTRYTINPTQINSMMIGHIYYSAHALAEMHVRKRNHKKQNRHRNKERVLHLKFTPAPDPSCIARIRALLSHALRFPRASDSTKT